MAYDPNQTFFPCFKWPFATPPASPLNLPPTAGVSEDVLRRWFYLVRYWEFTVSGTFTVFRPGIGTFEAVFAGSQVIPAQKITVYGDDWAAESADLTIERDILAGVEVEGESVYGTHVQAFAYELLGKPWGVTATTTYTPTSGDPTVFPAVVAGAVTTFGAPSAPPIVAAPGDSTALYPSAFLGLASTLTQVLKASHYAHATGPLVVGQYVIDDTISMDIFVDGAAIPDAEYSGDVMATLKPKATGGFWAWARPDGSRPRWDVDTGERIAANWD